MTRPSRTIGIELAAYQLTPLGHAPFPLWSQVRLTWPFASFAIVKFPPDCEWATIVYVWSLPVTFGQALVGARRNAALGHVLGGRRAGVGLLGGIEALHVRDEVRACDLASAS